MIQEIRVGGLGGYVFKTVNGANEHCDKNVPREIVMGVHSNGPEPALPKENGSPASSGMILQSSSEGPKAAFPEEDGSPDPPPPPHQEPSRYLT